MRISDWSSDVCSSDLVAALAPGRDPIQRPEDVVLIGCKHRGRGGESPRHLGLRQRGGLHHHCDADRQHRYSACSHQFSPKPQNRSPKSFMLPLVAHTPHRNRPCRFIAPFRVLETFQPPNLPSLVFSAPLFHEQCTSTTCKY